MSSQRQAPRLASLLMALGTLTLFGASTVHLGVAIPLGFATLRDPFGGAAIPEAVLGVILGIAAVTVLASARRAWAIGIATTTFAIFVVLYGMSITVRGGRIGDVVYHALLLLILMIAGVALLRSAGTSSS